MSDNSNKGLIFRFVSVTLMDPMMSGGSQISETWGNPLSEVSENPLSSNDPFNVDLEPGPKIKFLPTQHIQWTRKSNNYLIAIFKPRLLQTPE